MRLLLLSVAAMAMVAPVPTRARQVKFAVVAFGTDVKVDVGGTVSALAAPFPDNPYFNGTIEVPDGVQSYKYVVDAASEPFDRSIDRTTASTFNDFFGRKDTISQPPQFGFAFPGDKREQWTRGSKAEIFDDSYIPTVHFSGPNADSWVKNTGDAQVNVMFVSQRDVLTFQNVEASTKNEETVKAALKLKFPGEDFYGRSSIKLRNSEEDVTMLREKIYADMLTAVGCPTMGTAIARVYYNKQPLGLYVLQDSAPDEGFIASLFYGNPNDSINRPTPMGTPLDGASGSDFEYKEGVTLPYNSFLPPPGVVPNPEKIAAVSKALNDLDVTNAAAVADFESGWFDIETFFRAAAFEYLAGHWDSYWFFTTNFVVYDDPTESNNGRSKFYFIDQDFDQTFGVNIGPQYNSVGADFTKQSYTTLLKDRWKITELDAETRTIINKLIRTPGSILKSRFENILISIVKRLFNPVAFKRKIDGLSQRFRPEVEWDRTISPRPRAGKSYGFTIEDFDTGLTGPSVKGGAAWGLMQWVTERATAVASEFNFQWDSIAAGPPGSKDSSAPVRSAATYAMASAVAAVLVLTASNLI